MTPESPETGPGSPRIDQEDIEREYARLRRMALIEGFMDGGQSGHTADVIQCMAAHINSRTELLAVIVRNAALEESGLWIGDQWIAIPEHLRDLARRIEQAAVPAYAKEHPDGS